MCMSTPKIPKAPPMPAPPPPANPSAMMVQAPPSGAVDIMDVLKKRTGKSALTIPLGGVGGGSGIGY